MASRDEAANLPNGERDGYFIVYMTARKGISVSPVPWASSLPW